MRHLALIAAVFATACTSNNSSGDDQEMVNCAAEPRADTFTMDMVKHGSNGMIDFTLHTAQPAPPAQGNNTWEVQLSSAGAPMAGATIAVKPYMPDHMHAAELKAAVTDEGDGMYKLTPVNLWMPGLWQTTLDVTPAGAAVKADSVVFSFCIPN